MAKLPPETREKVMDYCSQGYSTDEIAEMIKKEAEPHLKPNQDLKRCIASIKGHWSQGHKVTNDKPIHFPNRLAVNKSILPCQRSKDRGQK
jgi:hypothetical protein